ncbi:uncharacterized protein BO88DRAFT_39920 [Aspergillus vadensis CBS 113365]|uniref:Uncharacterized protein n=1 Tax=Aspergillus vadensis (strain CBS 113365 / IMI 142717 / IBT 24658) TaxID=1448311 RepID=A0A319BFZ8_ASPVC|nr:hypothetical protein BO88DRAFT_39920 [Aspergillus vadensis CBS 113365]PYH69710.1 hypothetical protein BO88DRAFT_39920 [Aspergillus vadensis CBS 113365]
MINRCGKLNMSEMTRTLLLAFLTSFTVPLPINCSQAWIVQTLCARPLPLIVLFVVLPR